VDSDRIHAVLRQLTPSEQSAVRLIVCEGLDYQAAARSLGVPVSTINNWKHRALIKLKQLIESERPLAEPQRAVG
jgi:RNA polymerase sigma factor (sigma-70 family)